MKEVALSRNFFASLYSPVAAEICLLSLSRASRFIVLAFNLIGLGAQRRFLRTFCMDYFGHRVPIRLQFENILSQSCDRAV